MSDRCVELIEKRASQPSGHRSIWTEIAQKVGCRQSTTRLCRHETLEQLARGERVDWNRLVDDPAPDSIAREDHEDAVTRDPNEPVHFATFLFREVPQVTPKLLDRVLVAGMTNVRGQLPGRLPFDDETVEDGVGTSTGEAALDDTLDLDAECRRARLQRTLGTAPEVRFAALVFRCRGYERRG